MARIHVLSVLALLAAGCSESQLEAEYNLTLQRLEKKQAQKQKQFNEEALRQLEEMKANAEAMNEAMLTEALEIAKAKGQIEVDAFLSQRQEKVKQLQREVDSRQKGYEQLLAEVDLLKRRLQEIERRLGRKLKKSSTTNSN